MKILALFLGIILVSSVLLSNQSFVEAVGENKQSIPSWIKDVAGFWASNQISDEEYLAAIQWLIDNGILKVSQEQTGTIQSQTSSIQDVGDFYAVYSPINNPELKFLEKGFQKIKALEIIADSVNLRFKLPYDVPLIFSECGTQNAYYDSNKKELVFCYELFAYYLLLFYNLGYDVPEASLKAAQVFAFVVYHELGHALIDVYDLPTTGMEEDSVDQLATLILAKKKTGLQALESTSIWFAAEGVRESISDQLPFWDDHSLNQQRFFNVLCWMYGSSPEEYSSLVDDDLLPIERAVKCPSEYEKISKSWKTLLSPYADLEI